MDKKINAVLALKNQARLKQTKKNVIHFLIIGKIWLFLAVPRGCLRFVIVVFPDHTHLLFLILHVNCLLANCKVRLKYFYLQPCLESLVISRDNKHTRGLDKRYFQRKTVNIFLPIIFNMFCMFKRTISLRGFF